MAKKPEPATPAPSASPDLIADKLRASRAAHQAAKEARQRRETEIATVHLREAFTLRRDAEQLDPGHTVDAWREGPEVTLTPRGTDTHTELMAFYRQQLGDE
jgi:hypothetical protein